MPRRRKRVVQEHHVKYAAQDGYDETVLVFKGEHHILTLLGLYTKNTVSTGFIYALKRWLTENEHRGMNLTK